MDNTKQIVVDMSGSKGLSANYTGDADTIVSLPYLRTDVQDGEIAQGLFNPYLRVGYLAPVSTNKTTITADVTVDKKLTSSQYNYVTNLAFFATNVGQLFKLDSLTDISLTQVNALTTTSSLKNLSDLEIYELNGVRQMYGIYNKNLANTGTENNLGVIQALPAPTLGGGTAIINVPPLSTTVPTLTTQRYAFAGSTSSFSLSKGVTVASTSNSKIFAVVASSASIVSCGGTVGGSAMSLLGSGNSGAGTFNFYILYFTPVATSNTVAITISTSGISDVSVFYYGVDNIGSGSVTFSTAVTSTTTGIAAPGVTWTKDNSLIIQSSFNTSTTVSALSGQTLLTTGTDSAISTWISQIHTYDTTYPHLQLVRYKEDGTMVDEEFLKINTSPATPANAFIQQIKGNWQFMRKSDNGYAYIFTDNSVHKFDGTVVGGTTGTLIKNVIQFPSNFRITDAVDFRSRLYMVVHQYPVDVNNTSLNNFVGECGIFVWDRISSRISSTDYYQLPGIREVKKIFISPEQILKVICINNAGIVEIRSYGYNRDSGGVVFTTERILGIGAYPQYPDSLTTANDKVMWLANDANVYSYKDKAITNLFRFKAQTSTATGQTTNIAPGVLFYGSGSETASSGYRENKQGIIASYYDSSPYVYKIYPFDLTNGSNSSQTPDIGSVYTGVSYMPITSVVKNLRIYNAPIAGSGSSVIATIKIFFNQGTSAVHPGGLTKSITKDEAKRGYVDFKIHHPYLNAIQICIEWATSEPIGADMYLPSAAIVTYEPTKVQSPDNG